MNECQQFNLNQIIDVRHIIQSDTTIISQSFPKKKKNHTESPPLSLSGAAVHTGRI